MNKRKFAVYIDADGDMLTDDQLAKGAKGEPVEIIYGEYGFTPIISSAAKQDVQLINSQNENLEADLQAALRCCKCNAWHLFPQIQQIISEGKEPDIKPQLTPVAEDKEEAEQPRVFYTYGLYRSPQLNQKTGTLRWVITEFTEGEYSPKAVPSRKSPDQLNAEKGHTHAEVYAAILCARQEPRKHDSGTNNWKDDYDRLVTAFSAKMGDQPIDLVEANEAARIQLAMLMGTHHEHEQQSSAPAMGM